MDHTAEPIAIYLEHGTQRVVAGALAWPGWCRIGRDPATAIQALSSYQERYAQVLAAAAIAFPPPVSFSVIEELNGDASTDFGVPGKAPSADAQPVDAAELARLVALLQACWQKLDLVALAAAGHALRSGPRGGGRDLAKMLEHVYEAERGYTARLAARLPADATLEQRRSACIAALTAVAQHGVPPPGPRGGARWSAPYFVRRAAWHVLDHAWEIEDRLAE